MSALRRELEIINNKLDELLRRHPNRATTISLGFPLLTRKDSGTVANFELPSDEIATIPILTLDAAGAPVPAPTGDTFTAVATGPAGSTATALGATIQASPAALVLTPTVVASPGWSVVITDADGLSSYTLLVDIVSDVTPKAISIGTPTFVSQPTPTAPGP